MPLERARGALISIADPYSYLRFARYIFMEFKTREDAEYAINAMNNVPFDSKHTFHLNHFLDVEKYTEMDPTYVEPEPEVYKPGVRSHI